MLLRVVGRPVLPRMDRAAQQRRAMSRCQRRIVSGVTSSRSPWRRAFGITLSRAVSRARSAQVEVRAAWLPPLQDGKLVAQDQDLCGLPCLLAPDSRRHAASRVIRRNTNRRHMTGDHHRRVADTATLLLTAMDGILGTHRKDGLLMGWRARHRP